jgi:hypothetical protein
MVLPSAQRRLRDVSLFLSSAPSPSARGSGLAGALCRHYARPVAARDLTAKGNIQSKIINKEAVVFEAEFVQELIEGDTLVRMVLDNRNLQLRRDR